MKLTGEELDRVLQSVEKTWNVGVWGQALLWIWNRDETITLAKIESRLRALGSRTTYFVAAPLDTMPSSCQAAQPNGKPADYWLWICLQGEPEMQIEIAKAKATVEENLRRLETTGLLMML